MYRWITASFCAVTLAATAAAQQEQVIKGSKRDLRGATSVVVDTGHDRELRDIVVFHLEREVPELVVVAEPVPGALVVRFSRSIAGRAKVNMREPGIASASARTLPEPRAMPSVPPGGPRDVQAPRLPSYTQSTAPRGPDLTFDPMPTPARAPSRYVVGSVLRSAGDGRPVEAMQVRQPVMGSFDAATRDFVRKLAKAYRDENRIHR